MKASNDEEMKAVVAYMYVCEDVGQIFEMNFENPDDSLIESTILCILEKAGIKVDDVDKLNKQVAYYYTDGQYDIDRSVLDDIEFPDIEKTIEELNIL